MVVVLLALILVFVAGFVVGGVRAAATTWLARLALMWLALLPMTILGAPWKIRTGTYAAYIT
jgi:ABC-2 type transport system permease protein